MEAWFRRQFNRIERETQLNLHKVTHLIGGSLESP